MDSFAIEIYRPGVNDASVRQLTDKVKRIVAEMSDVGLAVRYRGCTLLPGDEVCFIRIEADGLAAVERIRRRLGIDDARAIRMMDVT